MADDSGGVVSLIWANLVGRFDELKEINNWFDHVPRLCVVGRPDAAPRALYQTLFGEPAASAVHGEGDAGWEVHASFTFEELPGGGFVGAQGPEETALTYLRETDAVVMALPAERLPGPHERALLDHVKRLRRTQLAVVHTPLGEGERPPRRVERLDPKAWTEWVLEVRRAFDKYDLAVLPVRRGAAVELVAVARLIHEALEAKLRLMFIGRLKHSRCRDALVNKVIFDYGKSAAFLGASPIPYADAVALTPLQVLLVIRVAGAYGKRLKPAVAKEFVGTVAGVAVAGLGFREVFRGIVRRWHDPPLPLRMGIGAAVAFAGTQVIGQAAKAYFSGAAATPAEAAKQAAGDPAKGLETDRQG